MSWAHPLCSLSPAQAPDEQRNEGWRGLISVCPASLFPFTSKEEEEEDSSPGVSFSLSSEESEMEPEEERIRYSQRLVSIGPKQSYSVPGSVATEERKGLNNSDRRCGGSLQPGQRCQLSWWGFWWLHASFLCQFALMKGTWLLSSGRGLEAEAG